MNGKSTTGIKKTGIPSHWDNSEEVVEKASRVPNQWKP